MTATMLSRNASLLVEFVLKYATPIPFPFWPISVKKTVPFSLPSSVFMKICPCAMLPVGVNLAMALPVSLVFIVSVELGNVIVPFPASDICICVSLIGVAATVLPCSTKNGFSARLIALLLLVAILSFASVASAGTLALAVMSCIVVVNSAAPKPAANVAANSREMVSGLLLVLYSMHQH